MPTFAPMNNGDFISAHAVKCAFVSSRERFPFPLIERWPLNIDTIDEAEMQEVPNLHLQHIKIVAAIEVGGLRQEGVAALHDHQVFASIVGYTKTYKLMILAKLDHTGWMSPVVRHD